jgi:hypothetical protein
MSIATPPRTAKSPSKDKVTRAGADQLIESRIDEACRALWWAELVRSVLKLTVFTLAAVLGWVVIDQWVYSPGWGGRLLAFVGFVAAIGTYAYRRLRPLVGSTIRPEYAARSLERDLPELRHSLTSYVTLRGDRESGDLRSRVVRSIGAATASQLRVHDALPHEATGTLRWWVATACALAAFVAYAAFSSKNTLQSVVRLAAPIASVQPPLRVSIREVQPGHSFALAGRPIEISASIQGLRSQEEAVCQWELPSGRQTFNLIYDSATRRHAGQLALPHAASGIVRYSISAGDASAGPYELTVQDVPVVVLESVHYAPPKYTGLAPYTSNNGAIAAVDGTQVSIQARTNRPVAKAKIEFNPRPIAGQLQATAGATELQIAADGTSLTVSFPLRSARGRSAAVELEDYRILVWDEAGDGNPDPILYPIRVAPDLPPEVAITVPASSPKEVPIDAQQIIEVHASDPDFGLKSISLQIRAGIDLVDEPVLWESENGEKGHRVAEFALRPKDLQLRIGDTVQVIAVATDNRSSDPPSSLEPNVVATDPVTLKITAAGPLPDPDDPSADGLTSPQEKANDDQSTDSSGKSGDGSGQKQAGGGGAGSGGQSQSQSDQGQAGGGSGGKGTEGQSEGDSSQGQGSSQSEGSSKGNDSGSGNSEGSSGASDPSSPSQPAPGSGGQSDPAGGSGGDQDASKENQGNGSEQGKQGDESTGENGDNQSDTEPASENSSTENQGANQGAGQGANQGAGQGANQGASPSADSSSDPQGTGDGKQGKSPGQESNADGQSDSSDAAGSQGAPDQGANDSQQPPKHDGEAFERIQQYLEKKRPQGSQGSSASNQPPSDANQQSGDSESSSGTGAKPESDNQTGAGKTGSENPQGESDSQSSPSADQGNNQQGNGSEAPASQSATEPSANQQNGANDSAATGDPSSSTPPASGEQSGSQSGEETGTPSQASQSDRQSQPDQGAQPSTNNAQGSGAQPSPGDSPSPDGQPENGNDTASSEGSGSGSAVSSAKPRVGEPGASNATASASSGGGGEESEQGNALDQPPPPPDPANLEYAKKATDLVLDYLDQTREAPDPKLLEDLQWTKEDLERFAERWQKLRELAAQPGSPQASDEFEESLQSLGLRTKEATSAITRESGDSLRRIRDSGNRQPPPAAHRDAFDAFRRSVGKQK